MPSPSKGESRSKFVNRCVSIVLDDGTAETSEQAVAVCHSLYYEHEKNGKSSKQSKPKAKQDNQG